MSLFKRSKSNPDVETEVVGRLDVSEDQRQILENIAKELNEKMAGIPFDFSREDYKRYMKDAKEYVETNSVFTVTDMYFGTDRMIHLTIEPKPRRFTIEVKEEEVEEDGE